MSDTDIYKNRERMPVGGNGRPKRKRRRHSSMSHPFDEKERRRRSRNSGFRRFLHLIRKDENEKFFWWILFGVITLILVSLAVWQYVIRKHLIEEKVGKVKYHEYQPRHIPEHPQPSQIPDSASE